MKELAVNVLQDAWLVLAILKTIALNVYQENIYIIILVIFLVTNRLKLV